MQVAKIMIRRVIVAVLSRSNQFISRPYKPHRQICRYIPVDLDEILIRLTSDKIQSVTDSLIYNPSARLKLTLAEGLNR